MKPNYRIKHELGYWRINNKSINKIKYLFTVLELEKIFL
jgi:hypothetical protein